MPSHRLHRPLPESLLPLVDLALDMRWTWTEKNERLWDLLDPEAWERTKNPYLILQNAPPARLEEAANDARFKEELRRWLQRRKELLEDAGWFGREHAESPLKHVAYFSMEFGLSEALPIYSGGLGILAGDHLKTASDLGVPLVGVGLLYQQGYFRQSLAPDAWQLEAFPYNDPTSLPIAPVQPEGAAWLRIKLELPGRGLLLRVWQARVGRVTLYLLDSNDPLNSPTDRGITATLYPAGQERRLIQEIVLGIGGWMALEAVGIDVDVCHLNEGHAAFAVLARAVSFMHRSGQTFPVALWATRAGNVFTTHTPVAAAFDSFEPAVIERYARHLANTVHVPIEHLLALGRLDAANPHEPFNMNYLAMRGSARVNGVSRLHGQVSRQIFQPLFPGWPAAEVPVGHVTNGVHIPTWDSPPAQRLWSRVCGADYWHGATPEQYARIAQVSDAELWDFRAAARQFLVDYVRRRLVRQVREHGAPAATIQRAHHVLDPDALTLGLARRFTAYKRPTLLLHDADRLARLLSRADRPVQLIVAGKAHPNDEQGKLMVQAMARFAARPDLFARVVFLEDYDMTLGQHLAAGIDVWINTPRRPWEACGTSGMKMLINGGLNLSELDGWWAEAYVHDLGWALGDRREHTELDWDSREAAQLYDILEHAVIPEFYERNEEGIPEAWIARVRASMSQLTHQFSSDRMLREYVRSAYLPAAAAYERRATRGAKLASELDAWQQAMADAWGSVRFGAVRVTPVSGYSHFEVQVYLGDLQGEHVRVELYAESPPAEHRPTLMVMERRKALPGTVNGHLYTAEGPNARPATDYTARIVPYHPDVLVPLEITHILWQR